MKVGDQWLDHKQNLRITVCGLSEHPLCPERDRVSYLAQPIEPFKPGTPMSKTCSMDRDGFELSVIFLEKV